jgi:hypothetical protein
LLSGELFGHYRIVLGCRTSCRFSHSWEVQQFAFSSIVMQPLLMCLGWLLIRIDNYWSSQWSCEGLGLLAGPDAWRFELCRGVPSLCCTALMNVTSIVCLQG